MCPWCRIGERRFARAMDAFDGRDDLEVVFRPFQLDPSAPEAGEPVMARLERKYGADAGRMLESATAAAREEGLTMRFDAAKSVNTLRAHGLMEWALETAGPGAQRALADVLFTVHFEDGADVGDVDVLTAAAASVGLDLEAARAALASQEGVDQTRRAVERALQMGIRSVPTFVFEGRWAVEGAQATETFVSVMERVRRELEEGA